MGVVTLDITAGFVATPGGVGKYAGYSPETGTVVVEMEHAYLVEYPGKRCFPV